jgi:catechol 2,3-dioxygenase-like lactoylglutathione lyase family enzyme
MRVLGLVFTGTRTPRPRETADFFTDVLGLTPHAVEGSDATFFQLPDGALLSVQPVDDETEERTVGLLVDDADAAVAELRAAGVETDDVQRAGGLAYAHFRAPDGRLYELVQRLPVHAGQQPGQHDRSP